MSDDRNARYGSATPQVERLLRQVEGLSEQGTTILSFAWMEAWKECEAACFSLAAVAAQAGLEAQAAAAFDDAERAAQAASRCAAIDANWAIAYAAEALVVRDQLSSDEFEQIWWTWGIGEMALRTPDEPPTFAYPDDDLPDPAAPFGPQSATVERFLPRLDRLVAKEFWTRAWRATIGCSVGVDEPLAARHEGKIVRVAPRAGREP